MAKEQKEEFVVADRRKFTSEGDLRPDATPEQPPAPEQKPIEQKTDVPRTAEKPEREEIPAPPSHAEQHAQNQDYKAAGKRIDTLLDEAGAQRPADMEITFERLIASLYMQAMAQLGMIREEDTPPRPDVISARQTIDTISLLAEKTKGNLTDRESNMLQNVLFELRMAFLEITNVLTRPPAPGAPDPSGVNKKK